MLRSIPTFAPRQVLARPAFAGLVVLAALAALAPLSGCSTHPEIQPSLQRLDGERLGVQGAEPAPVAQDLSPWWEAYGDARLSALIQQALAGNPNMQAAVARLQRVAAQERFTRGADLPQLQASAEVDRQRFTDHGLVPPPLAGAVANTGTLQLSGSWEIDLFGKQHAEVEASIGQTRASEADVQATRVLLSSQVARHYVALGRLQAQVGVLQRTLGQRDDVLKLIRQRVQAGLDTCGGVDRVQMAETDVPDDAGASGVVVHPDSDFGLRLVGGDLLLNHAVAADDAFLDASAGFQLVFFAGEAGHVVAEQANADERLLALNAEVVPGIGGGGFGVVLGIGDVEFVAGIDEVGIGAEMAEAGVVGVIVDGPPIGEAAGLGDGGEAISLDDGIHGHESLLIRPSSSRPGRGKRPGTGRDRCVRPWPFPRRRGCLR